MQTIRRNSRKAREPIPAIGSTGQARHKQENQSDKMQQKRSVFVEVLRIVNRDTPIAFNINTLYFSSCMLFPVLFFLSSAKVKPSSLLLTSERWARDRCRSTSLWIVVFTPDLPSRLWRKLVIVYTFMEKRVTSTILLLVTSLSDQTIHWMTMRWFQSETLDIHWNCHLVAWWVFDVSTVHTQPTELLWDLFYSYPDYSSVCLWCSGVH